MRTLNLGILAHVDAGKTSLTERLLYTAGVIDHIGSVDGGDTQTDTLALERQRGITIKAAVVSFPVNGVTVNLIDTPGHPDFIAEVERALSVLDGAVLVISAVEGVQAQTRILMRALQRLRLPTLLFINKIDRTGADPVRVLNDIAAKLTPAVIPMCVVSDPGTRAAAITPYDGNDPAFVSTLFERLAEQDDDLMAAYIDTPAAVTYRRLRRRLASHSRRALLYPVYCGSAITGAGVDTLLHAITDLLPAPQGNATAPLSGTVFKVERGPAGEKIAYVRLFTGSVSVRDRVDLSRGGEGRVTAIRLFQHGASILCSTATAGQFAKLWGLGDVRIGDTIGVPRPSTAAHHFAPPTLETVVVPSHAAGRAALHLALTQLAEQDPLINLRQDDLRGELSLSLYGEVQKEVIQATLLTDYGLDVQFRESTVICIERPLGLGAAFEFMRAPGNPFLATVGLRVEPAPHGSGVSFRQEIEVHGTMPAAFFRTIEDTVYESLHQGIYGWRVTDCTVTLTHTGYAPRQSHAHQGFSKAMSSTGADFRGLTPLVLMAALEQAGTTVYEPVHHFHLEAPADTLPVLLRALARLGVVPHTQDRRGAGAVLEGEIPAALVHELRLQLPGLTRGEGVFESGFERYQPVRGPAPVRARTDFNPLNREEYLLHIARRV